MEPKIMMRKNAVGWCSDWLQIDSVPGLKMVHGGPATYNQTDFVADGSGAHLPHVLDTEGFKLYQSAQV